jgi:hypothetical protein
VRVLARRLRRTDNNLADMIFTDVPGRVAKQLLLLAQRFGTQEGDAMRVTHDLTKRRSRNWSARRGRRWTRRLPISPTVAGSVGRQERTDLGLRTLGAASALTAVKKGRPVAIGCPVAASSQWGERENCDDPGQSVDAGPRRPSPRVRA